MLILILLILGGITAFSFFYFSNMEEQIWSLTMLERTGQIPSIWIPWLLVALVLLVVLLWVLVKLFSVPRNLKHRGEVRSMKKSRDTLDNGLLELQAGNFQKGESLLTSYMDGSSGDAIKYLAAANSARERGADTEAEAFLIKAGESSAHAGTAVRITQAEMMLEREEFTDAETLLLSLHRSNPKNTYVMTLLGQALEGTGNAEKLSNLTRIMRSRTNIPAETIESMEVSAWEQLIRASDTDDLGRAWDSLPAEAHGHERIVSLYSRRLMDSGDHDRAETILQKTLNTNWSDKLAERYGQLDNANTAKQIEQAEKWMAQHPKSAGLSLAIGKLAAKRELWGKARESLVRAVQLDTTPNNCAELGEVLEAMGDMDNARDCFKSAAAIVKGNAPVGALLDIENLPRTLGINPSAAA